MIAHDRGLPGAVGRPVGEEQRDARHRDAVTAWAARRLGMALPRMGAAARPKREDALAYRLRRSHGRRRQPRLPTHRGGATAARDAGRALATTGAALQEDRLDLARAAGRRAAQLSALAVDGGRPPLAIVAPAFPATGRTTSEAHGRNAKVSNRTRKIRSSEIIGGRRETSAMVGMCTRPAIERAGNGNRSSRQG
jgi:hypothetical protein